MAVLKPVLLFFAGARDALSRHSRSMILALTFDRLAVSIQSLLGVLCLKAFSLTRPSMPDPAVVGSKSGQVFWHQISSNGWQWSRNSAIRWNAESESQAQRY